MAKSRTIPINIAAGAEVSQNLDMPKAGADLGQLQVRTEPPVHASASTAH